MHQDLDLKYSSEVLFVVKNRILFLVQLSYQIKYFNKIQDLAFHEVLDHQAFLSMNIQEVIFHSRNKMACNYQDQVKISFCQGLKHLFFLVLIPSKINFLQQLYLEFYKTALMGNHFCLMSASHVNLYQNPILDHETL